MAQPGFTPIVVYHSNTSGNVPSASNLAEGEVAVNIPDRRTFIEDSGGTVRLLTGVSPILLGRGTLSSGTELSLAVPAATTLGYASWMKLRLEISNLQTNIDYYLGLRLNSSTVGYKYNQAVIAAVGGPPTNTVDQQSDGSNLNSFLLNSQGVLVDQGEDTCCTLNFLNTNTTAGRPMVSYEVNASQVNNGSFYPWKVMGVGRWTGTPTGALTQINIIFGTGYTSGTGITGIGIPIITSMKYQLYGEPMV